MPCANLLVEFDIDDELLEAIPVQKDHDHAKTKAEYRLPVSSYSM